MYGETRSRHQRMLSLFMAVAMMFSLAGCGCKSKNTPVTSEEESSQSQSETTGESTETAGDTTTGDSTNPNDPTNATGGSGGGSGSSGQGSSGSGGTSSNPPPVLSGDFKIVENGQAVSTIVISASAGDKVKTAAADLQDYIKRMTGATVKIGYDSTDRSDGNYILVGPSAYTKKLGISQPTGYPNNEKVILKREKNYLALLGNDDGTFIGTQNAVTMFLEKQGCGWFGPDELWQVVPQTKNMSVGSLNITHVPKFISRENNVHANNRAVANRWYLGGAHVTTGHYLPHLVGKDVYFSTHPEWFSLIDGKRDVSAQWWQYCYSNGALAEEFGKKIIAYFDTNPDTMTYSITANDGWETDWCECDECSKYPTDTDLMLTFANNVARVVAKKYPDKKLAILSYHSTWFAPQTNVKAEPNVEVMFCAETSMTSPIDQGLYLGDTRNPITHNTYKTSWKNNFLEYKKKANLKNISVWKWYCVAVERPAWQNVPWVQGNVAIRDQNYWKANGASYVFYDQGPLANYRETDASFPLRWPLWYVASKGMWDASLTGDQILMEACQKLYGNGASAMLKYYQELANASEQCTAPSICWIPPTPGEIYTSSSVSKIDAAVAGIRSQLNKVTATERKRMENQISYWENAKPLF